MTSLQSLLPSYPGSRSLPTVIPTNMGCGSAQSVKRFYWSASRLRIAAADFGFVERSQTNLPVLYLMLALAYTAFLFHLHRLLAVGKDPRQHP